MDFVVYRANFRDGKVEYLAFDEDFYVSPSLYGAITFESFLPREAYLCYQDIKAENEDDAIARAKESEGHLWKRSRFNWLAEGHGHGWDFDDSGCECLHRSAEPINSHSDTRREGAFDGVAVPNE